MIVTYAAAASAAVKVERIHPPSTLGRYYYAHSEISGGKVHVILDPDGNGMVASDCSCAGTAMDCPHVQAVVIRDMEDRAREATRALIRDSEREYEAARQEAQ